MNDDKSMKNPNAEAGRRNGGDETIRSDADSLGVNGRLNGEHEDATPESLQRYPESPDEKVAREFSDILIFKVRGAKLSEIIGVVTTIALIVIGATQAIVAWESYHDTTPLVDYARRNTEAAESFRDAAEGIEGGIDDAVGKLNLQAGSLTKSVDQASRLAGDTEVANQNLLESDRPWIGSYATINAFGENVKPSITFYFTNSGKRPARINLSAFKMDSFQRFPSEPESTYVRDVEPSTNFIVPGQPAVSQLTGDTALAPDVMAKIQSRALTFYACAEVRYTDVRTRKQHWTHFCIYYLPKAKSATDAGFRNCPHYNDAD